MNPWSNPDYARVYVEKYRAELLLKYAPLYRALNLSPDKVSQFESALADCMQAEIDIWAAASTQGLETVRDSAANTAVARMTSDPLVQRDEKLKAVLGDVGFAEFQQFDLPTAQGAREMVQSLASNLYASETPVTALQGEQLVQIIARNTQIVRTPMASDGRSPMFRHVPQTDWAAVGAQAQGVLSPPQLAVLQNVVDQQRLTRDLIEVQFSGPAASPAK